MTLKILLTSLLVTTAPPGQTAYSVEVARDCAPDAATCEGARRSNFYGSWVRQESEATGRARYGLIAEVIDSEARLALCIDDDGKQRCNNKWTHAGLVSVTTAIGTYESGWREDVAVGRGRSGKPSDDGGEGRGPGGERCLMQIHPTVLDDDALLGLDALGLSRCFRQAMAMLIHARRYCSWKAPKVERTWAVVSLYGTGSSCDSANNGKTRLRVDLARKIYARLRAEAIRRRL